MSHGAAGAAGLALTLRGASAAEVSRAQAAVAGHLARNGVAALGVSQAELLLEEVALNVLRHGFPAGQVPEVRILLHRDDAGWILDFEDCGIAFDPTTARIAPAAASLAQARIGGFGLPLIRRTAAALRYERSADGRNLLRVVLPGGPRAATTG